MSQYSLLEETVLDSFDGTGITAAAAVQCKRHFIVVEEDAVCFLLAADRLWDLA